MPSESKDFSLHGIVDQLTALSFAVSQLPTREEFAELKSQLAHTEKKLTETQTTVKLFNTVARWAAGVLATVMAFIITQMIGN